MCFCTIRDFGSPTISGVVLSCNQLDDEEKAMFGVLWLCPSCHACVCALCLFPRGVVCNCGFSNYSHVFDIAFESSDNICGLHSVFLTVPSLHRHVICNIPDLFIANRDRNQFGAWLDNDLITE